MFEIILFILAFLALILFLYIRNTFVLNTQVSPQTVSGKKDDMLIFKDGWKARDVGYLTPKIKNGNTVVGETSQAFGSSNVIGKNSVAEKTRTLIIGNNSVSKKQGSNLLGNGIMLDEAEEAFIAINTGGLSIPSAGPFQEKHYIPIKYNGDVIWIRAFDPSEKKYFKTFEGFIFIDKEGTSMIFSSDGIIMEIFNLNGGTWGSNNSDLTLTGSLIPRFVNRSVVVYDGGFKLFKLNGTAWTETSLFDVVDPSFTDSPSCCILTENFFVYTDKSSIFYTNFTSPGLNEIIVPVGSTVNSLFFKDKLIVSLYDGTVTTVKEYSWNGNIFHSPIPVNTGVDPSKNIAYFTENVYIDIDLNVFKIFTETLPITLSDAIFAFVSDDSNVIACTSGYENTRVYEVGKGFRDTSGIEHATTFSNNGDIGTVDGLFEWKSFN